MHHQGLGVGQAGPEPDQGTHMHHLAQVVVWGDLDLDPGEAVPSGACRPGREVLREEGALVEVCQTTRAFPGRCEASCRRSPGVRQVCHADADGHTLVGLPLAGRCVGRHAAHPGMGHDAAAARQAVRFRFCSGPLLCWQLVAPAVVAPAPAAAVAPAAVAALRHQLYHCWPLQRCHQVLLALLLLPELHLRPGQVSPAQCLEWPCLLPSCVPAA
jgi:hypothetical protein